MYKYMLQSLASSDGEMSICIREQVHLDGEIVFI